MYRSTRKMVVSGGTDQIHKKKKKKEIYPSKSERWKERTGKRDIPVAHSVCPLLFLTPPTAYLSVTICPGLVKSLSSLLGSASNRAVYARSWAEIPVETG